VQNSRSLPEQEVEIMKFWKERDIYTKTLRKNADKKRFVFYEGPPTANGMPHPGHCLTRAIKDLYPRYKTMRGFLCERKGGWDTHGLPVEVEVCKELGIHSKEEIEEYGIEPFIKKCRESVFRYMRQWEEMTERFGFWLNLDEAYVTYHKSYVESVWFILKAFFDGGWLYQGHKIVWWWAQGGTALSSGEVGQGYREVADPSVFVRFPLVSDTGSAVNAKLGSGDVDLIVWTTTPWTLPSNMFAAVHTDYDYAVVRFVDESEKQDVRLCVIAKELVETIAGKLKKKAEILETLKGSNLIGLRYIPPFPFYHGSIGETKGTLKTGGQEHINWRIVPADFVTLDTGSGIVHTAPAFGEDDFNLLKKEQERFTDGGSKPELLCCVLPNGKFSGEAPPYEGRWVKETDKDIVRDLKSKGLLLHQEQYLHEYPFCWRSEQDPLIQYPRKSWFIKTTQFKDAFLENNQKINWYPDHIKNGRFGNFLEANVDWALSRERYWGTPLPIWVCEKTGKAEAVESYSELLAKQDVQGTEVWDEAKKADPDLNEHLIIHKPYIDAITYASPFAEGARMRRVPEVIDCWFDSGAMPFAQWGYPCTEGSYEEFRQSFPADFISEAIDQTRGWFYSLLAIGTMMAYGVFIQSDGSLKKVEMHGVELHPHPFPLPFKNCIVLGLMLGEDGQKMSKSKRNYREPTEIFDKYGADALRWYFYANQAPWTAIRYSEAAIRDSMPEFMLRLQNVISFYEVYRKIDGFNPLELVNQDVLREDGGQMSPSCLASAAKSARPYRPIKNRCELDRWILSELNKTVKIVCEKMDAFDHFTAAGEILAFTDSLSNWYVRRSRDRFWSSADDPSEEKVQSKCDAYWTLYECLITITKLIAPFVPFLAENFWQRLVDIENGGLESVHLADYPTPDENLFNEKQSKEMQLIRTIVSLGRAARSNAQIKVRQPLAGVKVMFSSDETANIFLKSDVAASTQIILDELNIKDMKVLEDRADFDQYVSFAVLPDFKKLGKRLGKQMPEVKKELDGADASLLLAQLDKDGKIVLPLDSGSVELTADEIQIRLQAKDGWAAAQGASCVVVIATELTEELLDEGRAREIIRLIQDKRKDMNCDYTDRILVGIETKSQLLVKSLEKYKEYIKGETLADNMREEAVAENQTELSVDGEPLMLSVRVV
ncbi:MAG: isoleucine--tRNA ligase, partial [Planctomycetaceae bacterium]|nr:isoleucine--tRNA ligase [Planctomycetaceae bacterium]